MFLTVISLIILLYLCAESMDKSDSASKEYKILIWIANFCGISLLAILAKSVFVCLFID